MNISRRLRLLVIVSFTVLSAAAQMSESSYKVYAGEVRKEVWASDNPAFSNRTIPEKYANASAVIVAHQTTITANTKLKFTGLGTARSFWYTRTIRELVKINDKTSLAEYSEFSFQKLSKKTGNYGGRKTTVVIVGVRVIKPDGKVIDVDTNEAVSLAEADGKPGKSKLAISDLQVGDFIDYFARSEEKEEYAKMEPLLFVLGESNPVMNYSVHCDISEKYAVEFRSVNGAPDFKVVRGKENEFIMDVQKENIDAVPTDLWMSSARQIPIIRLNIITPVMGRTGRKPGVLYKNPPSDDFVEELKRILTTVNQNYSANPAWPYAKDVNKLFEVYRKAHKNESRDSLAYYIYYATRHFMYSDISSDEVSAGIGRNYQQNNNMVFIQKMLERFGIAADYVLVTSRFGPAMKQVTAWNDLALILHVKTEHPFFISSDEVFTRPGDIDSDYEGQDSPTLFYKKGKNITENNGRISIPVSLSENNRTATELKISWNDKNPLQLNITRKVRITGQQRSASQRRLLLFEQYEAEERNYLGIRQTLKEDLASARKTKNMTVEYEAAFEKARNEQLDYFKEEIKDEFDAEPANVKECRIINSGIFHSRPAFEFTGDFTMEGWVKKAGNNFIIDAGKLIGTQLQIKDAQRKRAVDVYMPYARSFEHDLQMTIPAGFKPEGVENLNKSIDNKCGKFIATARVEGDKILIHVTKAYKTNFEPVADWPLLLQYVDFSNDWTSQKILLRNTAN